MSEIKKLNPGQIGEIAQKAFEHKLKVIFRKSYHLERQLDTKDVRKKKFAESYASLPKRCADYVVTYPDGVTCYTEVKGIEVFKSKFYLARLETRQLGTCLQMARIGGRYDIIVYVLKDKTFYRITEKMIAFSYELDKSYVEITEKLLYLI